MLTGPFPSGPLTRGISEGTLLLGRGPAVRRLALLRVRETGARIVRIPVDWREVAPAAPPAGFDGSDPADPSYRFALIDGAVREAVALGLEPLLVVSHAPSFAEAPGRWPHAYLGSWAPDPAALEQFASALARRYDGAFPDPLVQGAVLPRVRLFQAWNEPNLARYLEPQWVAVSGRWSAFSPALYRAMLNAFYAGVKSVDRGDVVATAGVAPNGDRAGVGRMAPVQFLRGLLCVGSRRGRAVRAACPDPPHFDALAFHPLSVGDPDDSAGSSLDVAIADAAKVSGLLASAERLRTALPAGAAKGLWVTELNWEGAPASHGVPTALQARWISRALHRLWIAGVSLVAWQFLIDPFPRATASAPDGSLIEYQRLAGLFSAGVDGNPETAVAKPFLTGWRLPFDPLRISRRSVRVWALLASPGTPAVLQRERPRGRWATIATLHAGAAGVLNRALPLGPRVTLRLLSGGLTSASATP